MLSIIVMRFSPEESGTGSANAFMTEKDACALETMMERALPTHAGKIHPIPRGRVIALRPTPTPYPLRARANPRRRQHWDVSPRVYNPRVRGEWISANLSGR
jgi:hypothetical protein